MPGVRGRRRQEVRTFASTTRSLLQLRDWLISEQVTVVGMEATGDYWKPVFYLLEDTSSASCSTPGTCATFPGARPMWPTRCGSRNWSSTAWSGEFRAAARQPDRYRP
jgi:hypothetical protein